MIKNSHLLEEVERDFLLNDNLSILQKFKQMDSLWEECIALNKNLLKEVLEPKDSTIELARILNYVSKTDSSYGRRTRKA
jgi:hypothetical protein